jgi:hypothetical protein
MRLMKALAFLSLFQFSVAGFAAAMNGHMTNEKPRLVLLGDRRIAGLDLAKMFRNLTGWLFTVDQVMDAQQALDARYAELEEEMAESKQEKGDKVDYGMRSLEVRRHGSTAVDRPLILSSQAGVGLNTSQ